MRIAVSASGKSLDSDVDPRFGGSVGFVLFDTETGHTDYLDNSAQRVLDRSKGMQIAQMIAKAGTDSLITGQFGPNAAQVLRKSGIEIYACTDGTIREAIQALEQNELKGFGEDKVQPGPSKMGGRGASGGGKGRGQRSHC